MHTQIVDTLQISEDLKKSGCDAEVAKQIAYQMNLTAQSVIDQQALSITEHSTNAATKNDLEIAKLALRKDIELVKSDLKLEIEQVRSDLKLEIEQVRSDLKLEIEQVNSNLKLEIEQVKTSLLKWMISLFAAQTTIIISSFLAIAKLGFGG